MTQDGLARRLEEALRLCQTGAFEPAERLYREVTVEHPESPDAWNMLAVVLYQREALDEAYVAAARATELRPQIAPYWLMRGNIELAQHRYAHAATSLQRAVALAPDFPEASYRL